MAVALGEFFVITCEVVGLQAIEALILTFLTALGWAVIERFGSLPPRPPTMLGLHMLERFFWDSNSKSLLAEVIDFWFPWKEVVGVKAPC